MKASLELLSGVANQLRIHSISATTAAGNGHVTSCCSVAEIVAALFFSQMRFDPKKPRNPNNDRFILSKGHAAPILYAAWAEAGFFPVEQLKNLRKLDSDLEGHPTPRLPFVDVATGSLGNGLSNGLGMALSARLDRLDFRTYVLLGDGECAEGSVWEAASMAGIRKLNNLVAIIDVNRLGQSQETALGHNVEIYRQRFEAFGWRAVAIDGHDLKQILFALETVGKGEQPFVIIAKTVKGQGLEIANKDDWHGKPLPEKEAAKAIAELRPKSKPAIGISVEAPANLSPPERKAPATFPSFSYKKGEKVATREAYGSALLRIGKVDERIVALDGDVKNSTYAEKFFKEFPDRSFECFIAEQNMVGVASGMANRGQIPFVSTFACFFSRAFDQIRMAGISLANLKLCGSHAGVSIGEDGPSQMGLEDLAMMRAVAGSAVLCPCDAVSTEKLVEQMALTKGIIYLRTSRPKLPVLYDSDETFLIGGAKILRESDHDQITVVAAGVTVFEALKAADILLRDQIAIKVVDAYSVKPLAAELLRECARQTSDTILTVEDHYAEGGLGDAVAGELSRDGIAIHKLAVYELPRSGKPAELLAKYRIDANAIVEEVKRLIAQLGPAVVEEPFLVR
jgi:transketolase